MKHIYILGICGTFMGGLAVLARQLGFSVTGCDENVYPPMSDTLRAAGIDIVQGYDPQHLQPHPDLVVIGNALSRGNPAVEYVLNHNIPYTSGPQWLAEHLLRHRHVLAVSGTHGKTTTASLLAWILVQAGLKPGYLIGGVANDFKQTAALGEGPYFVIEADEYDTAFFDKRSKFIHYSPHTLTLNNLEHDHADIFSDLEAIKKQFQFLLRTVPENGLVICPYKDNNVDDVLQRGCWSVLQTFFGENADWQAQNISADGSQFEIVTQNQSQGMVDWKMVGLHNVKNALAAVAAANHVGIKPQQSIVALNSFSGLKRRLEICGVVNNITVYDDFAHHPTAIATTLKGLRAKVGAARIIAILQFASNTMKTGVHGAQPIANALQEADSVVMLESQEWDITAVAQHIHPVKTFDSVPKIVEWLTPQLRTGDHVLIMSNKGFDGIHRKLIESLQRTETPMP